MPITKTYTLYTYDELSDTAKAKAREWFVQSDSQRDHYWDDMFSNTLAQYGFPEGTMKLAWSISYSQGDGVAFSGPFDFEALAATASHEVAEVRDDKYLVAVRDLIEKSKALGMSFYGKIHLQGRYTHAFSMTIDLNYDYDDGTESEVHTTQFNLMQNALYELIRHLSSMLEKEAYEDIEYQDSDAVVEENILANEYTFLEDGTRKN